MRSFFCFQKTLQIVLCAVRHTWRAKKLIVADRPTVMMIDYRVLKWRHLTDVLKWRQWDRNVRIKSIGSPERMECPLYNTRWPNGRSRRPNLPTYNQRVANRLARPWFTVQSPTCWRHVGWTLEMTRRCSSHLMRVETTWVSCWQPAAASSELYIWHATQCAIVIPSTAKLPIHGYHGQIMQIRLAKINYSHTGADPGGAHPARAPLFSEGRRFRHTEISNMAWWKYAKIASQPHLIVNFFLGAHPQIPTGEGHKLNYNL